MHAQNSVGVDYYNGEGVEQNFEKAADMFLRAANQGYAVAQNNIGICCQNGKGVKQDAKRAFTWYKKAAEQGNASAQNNLRFCYYYGRGVEQNYLQVMIQYDNAISQGQKVRKNILGDCYFRVANQWRNNQRYTDTAESLYRKALDIFEQLVADDPAIYNDDYDSVMFELVDFFHDMKKYEEAESLYHKLISLREQLSSENPEKYENLLAIATNNLGSLYRTIGKYEESEHFYQYALNLRKKHIIDNPDNDTFKNRQASQLYRFGLLYAETNRVELAKASWKEAVAIWETMAFEEIGSSMSRFEDAQAKLNED